MFARGAVATCTPWHGRLRRLSAVASGQLQQHSIHRYAGPIPGASAAWRTTALAHGGAVKDQVPRSALPVACTQLLHTGGDHGTRMKTPKDLKTIIKDGMLKAGGVAAGVGAVCIFVPAMAMVAAGGVLLGVGALGVVAAKYRRELMALWQIYKKQKELMDNMGPTAGVDDNARRLSQLQDQLYGVFPKGHSDFGLPSMIEALLMAHTCSFEDTQELISKVQAMAMAAIGKDAILHRVVGSGATSGPCSNIEHTTVDGFTTLKLVFPARGSRGSGTVYVKAEEDDEGVVLKSVKVIETRTGLPYRVPIGRRAGRVIDTDYRNIGQ